jgi:hypothetical protein
VWLCGLGNYSSADIIRLSFFKNKSRDVERGGKYDIIKKA